MRLRLTEKEREIAKAVRTFFLVRDCYDVICEQHPSRSEPDKEERAKALEVLLNARCKIERLLS